MKGASDYYSNSKSKNDSEEKEGEKKTQEV